MTSPSKTHNEICILMDMLQKSIGFTIEHQPFLLRSWLAHPTVPVRIPHHDFPQDSPSGFPQDFLQDFPQDVLQEFTKDFPVIPTGLPRDFPQDSLQDFSPGFPPGFSPRISLRISPRISIRIPLGFPQDFNISLSAKAPPKLGPPSQNGLGPQLATYGSVWGIDYWILHGF